jgi:hypothetical protein
VSSPSSTDQDIIAIATNEHIIAAACAAAVPAIELIIACIAFHLVVTAHAEQRIVTREAFKQITTTPAGQLFSVTGTSDDRIVFTVGFTCGNALINLGVKWTPRSRQFSPEFKLSVPLHLQLNSAALFYLRKPCLTFWGTCP